MNDSSHLKSHLLSFLDYFRQPKPPPKRYLSNLPSKSPLDLSSYVMKKQKLSGASPEFNVPSFYNNPKVVGNEFEVWPTPSGLHFLSALFNTETAIKPAQRETLKGKLFTMFKYHVIDSLV